jgi:hypothetical protein
LLQAQLYEKFRKSRSVPASNFDFSPYQELSTGYYCFQSDRRKTFFNLDGRKSVAAKTTMPYFLCTDYAQTIFSMGHKVFSDDFKVLFLGGDLKVKHRTDIEEVFSKEHGLFHADEWLEQAKSIREYRPSLDRKQKRILHDELCGSRNEWIELCYKRESSVIIRFDSNSSVTEHDIDRHFASLVDVKSIYLPRDLDGSLKGTASLVCTSPAAARQLLSLFKLSDHDNQGHLKQHFDARGQIAFKEKSDLSNIKKDFLKAAAQWLYINRRIQYEEFIVPYYWPVSESSPPPTVRVSKEQYVTFLLMQWHQKRLKFGETHRRLEQDRERYAKLQADLKKNPKKIYSIIHTQSFISMACHAQRDLTAELKDDKVMYIVVKNAIPGHTLCKWMGKQAPFKDIHKKSYVAIQEFVQSVITEELYVNETFFETKDDFANIASSQPMVPIPPSEFLAEWTIDKSAASQKLQEFLRGKMDWIVFECIVDDRQWMELKKKTREVDDQLAELRANAIKCDIKRELEIRNANQSTYTIETSHLSSVTKPRSLIRFGQQVFCFKANNEAQAHRLKQLLPSLDAPNHTALWSRKKPTDAMSISDGKGSTVSLIVREDVTDASVLQFLQKILSTNVLPSICGVSEVALQACDNRKIEWLDIEGDEIKCCKWNRRSFRFRSKISVEYQNYLDHSVEPHRNKGHRLEDNAHAAQIFCPLIQCADVFVVKADVGQRKLNIDQWERDCFYQPFSQPILDLILLKRDFSVFRKLDFVEKDFIENIAVLLRFSGKALMQLIVTVPDADKPRAEKKIVWLVSLKDGSVEVVGGRSPKFEGCTIEMDQKCLANFLFSDVLLNQSVENKFQSILECGKDFWGRKISFSWHKKMNDTEVKEAVDSFWKVLKIWSNLAVLSVREYTVLSPGEGREVRKNDGKSRCDTQMENVSCCYCGCNYVVPLSVKSDFGDWDGTDDDSAFCCISHVDFSKEVQTKLQLPISRFKKSDKEMSKQTQDPARDKNLANLFRRIREIEKLLLLDISAGTQYILFFKCSKTNKLSQLRMQCRFRRDKYDGPVHLSFCIEGPTVILCSKKGEHEADNVDPHKEWSLKAGLGVTISLSEPIDEFADFSTTLSVDPEFYEHETPLLFGLDISKMKTRMCRVYGRLASKENGKENGISSDNEGNKLPAEWMRRLMEPEYYLCPRAVYPVVQFKLTVPENDDANDSVVSARTSNVVTDRTYCAVAASPYFDEHGLSDKQSKQDLKPKMDVVSQALRSFREVLKVESKLNDLNLLLSQLNQQIGACMHAATCGQASLGASAVFDQDSTPSAPSDNGLDDEDDQVSDDDDNWSTNLFDESSIPQGWVVLLRSSTAHGTWMELFHARRKIDPHIFEQSDSIRVLVKLPATKENADFQKRCSTDQKKDLSFAESTAAVGGEAASVVESHAPSSLSPLNRLKHIFDNSKSKKFIQPRHHFERMIAVQDSGHGHSNVTLTQDALRQLQDLQALKQFDLSDSPLIFLAKSFIDYVISTTAKTNPEHDADMPICVFRQHEFPCNLSEFIFDRPNIKIHSVNAKMCSALFRSLSKLPLRLDLDKQVDMKQKYFDHAIGVLLMDEKQKHTTESESKDGGLGALVACKTFNDTLDCLKLLEVFKYLCWSDSLFCKVRFVLIFSRCASIQDTITWI